MPKKSAQHEDKTCAYEYEILNLLRTRGYNKSICPSEVLRPEEKQNKLIMEQVRKAAQRLVAKGHIFITQKGQIVDPSSAKGPIRLKLSYQLKES